MQNNIGQSSPVRLTTLQRRPRFLRPGIIHMTTERFCTHIDLKVNERIHHPLRQKANGNFLLKQWTLIETSKSNCASNKYAPQETTQNRSPTFVCCMPFVFIAETGGKLVKFRRKTIHICWSFCFGQCQQVWRDVCHCRPTSTDTQRRRENGKSPRISCEDDLATPTTNSSWLSHSERANI